MIGMRVTLIAAGLGATVVVVGAYLFRHSEAALQIVALLGLIVGIGGNRLLVAREERRGKRLY